MKVVILTMATFQFICSGRIKPPNPKECILIIDEQTGEVTIERLGRSAVLKTTRQGALTVMKKKLTKVSYHSMCFVLASDMGSVVGMDLDDEPDKSSQGAVAAPTVTPVLAQKQVKGKRQGKSSIASHPQGTKANSMHGIISKFVAGK